jgi:hypothetical protein
MAQILISIPHAQRGTFTTKHAFHADPLVFTDGVADVPDDVALLLVEAIPGTFSLVSTNGHDEKAAAPVQDASAAEVAPVIELVSSGVQAAPQTPSGGSKRKK